MMRQSVIQLQGNPDDRETYKYYGYITIHEKKCFARYEKPLKHHPLDVAKNM